MSREPIQDATGRRVYGEKYDLMAEAIEAKGAGKMRKYLTWAIAAVAMGACGTGGSRMTRNVVQYAKLMGTIAKTDLYSELKAA